MDLAVERFKFPLRLLLSAFMIAAGCLHFLNPAPFVKIVPAALPAPALLVYISGFFEILGGIGLLLPPLCQPASWGLIALFIAVFPANINMAVNDIVLEGIPHIPWLYWLRLPLQAVLIAWAWWVGQPASETKD
ncbi:DoxX family protein [Gloeobacter kilaueensis]|uniref:DoxX family protein n=1 Tax=Gloeobacter kilaueensis (strain ATCC BAA-2537 / CCAP 1431/1 / ULC 316 / JS1) TaxID=1183438 RepID=U5QKH9_GLOK1|nr:DoxX family membrane protein [Gloeobacter kilaueensis]AGY59416.1 hypothetical protein GKIL_3170 [Gloeobacter kilaueensis JS1]